MLEELETYRVQQEAHTEEPYTGNQNPNQQSTGQAESMQTHNQVGVPTPSPKATYTIIAIHYDSYT